MYEQSTAKWVNTLLVGIFGLCFARSLWAMSVGWNNPILDMYGFRQSQTAISVYYLLKGGAWLAYETPVLGAPWSIPFEFPLYQWITALWAKLSGMPLDQAGRSISILFYYLTLWPSFILLGYLGITKPYRLIFLSLFLSSPLYLFWSRTFMIESTALFLGVAYLTAVGWYFQRSNVARLALTSALGTLGALVKATTFPGFALAAGLCTWVILERNIHSRENLRDGSKILHFVLLPAVGFALLPLGGVWLWTHFADAQKLSVPLAADFLTSTALKEWNFGILNQRISSELWKGAIFDRMLPAIFGSRIIGILSLALVPFMGAYKKAYFSSIFLFLSVMLIFTHLHIVHDYYQYANALFALAAIGFCLLSLFERGFQCQIAGLTLFLLSLGWCIYTYHIHYYHIAMSSNQSILDVAEAIHNHTNPEEVTLIYGFDWSSEIPYYSQRRALMDRDFLALDNPKMKEALQRLSDRRIGAIVFCLGRRSDRPEVERRLKAFDFQVRPIYQNGACEVYLPDTQNNNTTRVR